MLLLGILVIAALTARCCHAAPPGPLIQNLRARYDHASDSIYVQWTFVGTAPGATFTVRYRVTNRPGGDYEWKYAETSEHEAKLDLQEVKNNDELQVQVKANQNGVLLEDWSQSLLIAISKRVLMDGMPIDDDDLLPPLDFTANILSPTSVKLEWTPVSMLNKGNYYLVNVKQLTSLNGGPLLRQQIKIEANSFALGSLTPGERYEMTIRSATSPERVSSTAAIVEITMPRDDEYFEVGNLIISSHFKSGGEGTVNLTWEVPQNMLSKITSYNVQYAEMGTDDWHQLHFSGDQPSATLTTLKSDTDYVLKIRTTLYNNLTTESGQFRFRTPEVVPNPISKVDVVYTQDINSVRLQWTLEPFVPAHEVVGYEVYVTEDQDLPDLEWKHFSVPGNVGTLSLSDLIPGNTYYVRINVRKYDEQVMRAPSIYRFKTMERTEFLERREANSLSYRLIAPGRVNIAWTYPNSIMNTVTGCSVLYSEDSNLPMERWTKIDMPEFRQNSIILENLKPNSRYFVRIVPQINYSQYDTTAIDMFEIRTGNYPYEPNMIDGSDPRSMPTTADLGEQALARSSQKNTAVLTIRSCDPDSIKSDCKWDERCMPTVENHLQGWCISHSLRDAILNYS